MNSAEERRDSSRLKQPSSIEPSLPPIGRSSMPQTDREIEMTWIAIEGYAIIGGSLVIVAAVSLIRACS